MNGVRVLEVASWVYVPMAGGVLAEWGADVIKIEPPEGGDPQRGLISSGLLPGGGFANFAVEHPNRGKRSVAIDLETAEGRELVLKLAATADVFLTNFLPQGRRRLGIDVDDIRAVNPSIVYVRGSGNGQRGPEAERGGYDNCTFWARGGSADVVTPLGVDYPVSQPGGGYGDTLGGLSIAGGIAAALFHRERTGEGVTVDCSLLAMGAWATAFTIAMCSAFGLDSFPKGSRERSPNPIVGVYKTGDDRFISLVMLQSDRYWPGLVTAGGRPELAEDPRFANAEARAKNNAECIAALDEMFASHTLAEWREILATQRGVWSVVQTPREVMEDPQVLANGYVQEVVAADGSTFKLVTTPLQFGEQPGAPTRAPGLGEHTEDVLQEVGLQMDEILDLKIKGAVL